MPDPNVATVARFPDTATAAVRATVDAVLIALMNLEKTQGSLVRERDVKIGEKIDAFAVAAAKAVNPVDVVKQRADLETLRKAFDDQTEAITFWANEIGGRLDRISAEHDALVADAIDARIDALKRLEAKEQGDLDQVQSEIAELEARLNDLRARVQKRQQQAVVPAKKGPAQKGQGA